MEEYSPEIVEEELRIISSTLQVVHSMRDSDSIKMQQINSFELAKGARRIESLIYNVKPERQVFLTIGEKAITGRDLSFRSRHRSRLPESLEPGYELALDEAEEFANLTFTPPKKQLYVGGFLLKVNLDLVGQTLNEGGKITVEDRLYIRDKRSQNR
jgi:hypothetical protein